MSTHPLRIIQISDSHLFADTTQSLLGVPCNQSFQAVIDLIRKEEDKIDLIVHSGDISQDGSDAAYIRLADMLNDFHVPVYCIPGNHDNAKAMTALYPRQNLSNHRHIVLKHWHIILLNSQVPGHVHGHLDVSQMNYLQHCLQAYPEHHALIVFHHHPILVGVQWLDNLGLRNADEFWQMISQYPNVNTVLFGHIHQTIEQIVNGVKLYSAPATCFQFARNQDHFGIENLPQGYRWINIYDDGRVESGVKRLAHYVGHFDAHAKGY